MQTRHLMLLGGVVLALASVQPRAHAQRSLEKELADKVPALLLEYGVPGATVAVIREGKIELVQSFGVRRAGEPSPVDERTVFQAASLSKPIVAYGAHLLVQEGKLDLDRPLSEYLEAPYVSHPFHEPTRVP